LDWISLVIYVCYISCRQGVSNFSIKTWVSLTTKVLTDWIRNPLQDWAAFDHGCRHSRSEPGRVSKFHPFKAPNMSHKRLYDIIDCTPI
jgi:hypothetical protein